MLKKPNTFFRNAFEVLIGTKSGDGHYALYRLFSAAAILVIILIFALPFILWFKGTEQLGQMGDFFGGVLNPLLTFLTFTGLLITIVLQKTELREARREFERSADALHLQNAAITRQSFESTFFQMLSLHNTIVNAIRVQKSADVELRGRECFNYFYTTISDIYKSRVTRKGAPYYGDEQATIEYSFKEFWNDQQRNLGHYFRYLYNIIRFVSESEFRDGPYIRLIRAQLSDQELLVLFYNCLTPQGKNFKKLAEQFCLFDNMNPMHLLNQNHASLISAKAFGKDTG